MTRAQTATMLFLFLAWPITGVLVGQGRVIVIGVDGMDHQLTSQWMDEGRLPALSALAQQGTYGPLIATNPAQSPTSWASLVSGTNPGRTGIFGFLRRSIRDGKVVPELAMAEGVEREVVSSGFRFLGYLLAFLLGLLVLWLFRRRWRLATVLGVAMGAILLVTVRWIFANLPESVVVPKNLRTGLALWEELDREGVKVRTLGAPCAFPAPDLEHGHLLCGLGVPDLMGTSGSWVVWRLGPVSGGARVTQMGGKELSLRRGEDASSIEGLVLVGPKSPLTGRPLQLPVPIRLDDADGVVLALPTGDVSLSKGRFSDFLPVVFPWSELGGVIPGRVRFRLQSRDPLVIYQEPVQFDAELPLPFAPITEPPEYGADLTARAGRFETLGWAVATNPYQDELIDAATIMEDARGVQETRIAQTRAEAEGGDWRVLVSILSTPDRLQHVFFQDVDPQHPAHDPSALAERGHPILESYQRVDGLIHHLMTAVMRPDDVLLVVSDHGFAPFRHAVNLNRWLAEQGWLTARPSEPRSLDGHLGGPDAYAHMDWSKTQAYNLGLGRIWLNIEGREPEGVVKRAEAPALMEEIAKRLLAWRHDGRPVVRSVDRTDQIYRGDRLSEASDLVVAFERGYRISWNACLGGVDEPAVFENRTRWSGDHCSVHPDLVPGVLFCSRPLPPGSASVLDVYPTLRALLALPARGDLDGRSLLEPR